MPWESAVIRFLKLMERLGVDQALREAGVHERERVYIVEYELEYQECKIPGALHGAGDFIVVNLLLSIPQESGDIQVFGVKQLQL